MNDVDCMPNVDYKCGERKEVTFQQMCKEIAESKMLTKRDGTHPTALEIFNYSPTGELFMVYEWYSILVRWNELVREDLLKICIPELEKGLWKCPSCGYLMTDIEFKSVAFDFGCPNELKNTKRKCNTSFGYFSFHKSIVDSITS